MRRRRIRALIRWSLGSFVCLALITDIAVYSWATTLQKKKALHDEWESKLTASGDRVRIARDGVNGSMRSSAPTFEALQDNMRRVLDSVDAYDRELNDYQEICKAGLRDNLTLSDQERQKVCTLIAVTSLRIQQSQIQRTEAGRIISFDPNSGGGVLLKSELTSLDKQIDDLNKEAASELSEVGISRF